MRNDFSIDEIDEDFIRRNYELRGNSPRPWDALACSVEPEFFQGTRGERLPSFESLVCLGGD